MDAVPLPDLSTYQLLNSRQIAAILNVFIPKAYQFLESGEIRAIYVGYRIRVRP